MKHNFIKVLAGAFLFALTSCTGNYLDINSKPYEPGDLNPDDYALGAAFHALAGCVVSSDINTAQFTDCLLGGPMGGYFADSNPGFANTMSNFNAKDDWSRVFLTSDKIIPVLYSNLDQIEIISEETENPVPFAIAKVIKVAAMHRVADTFGPIPYSRLGVDASISVPYDPLDSVYEQFFKELDEAIEVLTDNQNSALVPSADYIFGGNVRKWCKLANSLKLRLAMRIVYADQDKAKKMAEEAVSHEIGVMTSNEDNAAWNYFGTVVNPIYTAVHYNETIHTLPNGSSYTTGGDTHAAADIIAYMNGYNDPRREKYFLESIWPGYTYVGLRRGIIIPPVSSGHNYSGVNVGTGDPVLWMNSSEVAFLRAEGIAVFGFALGDNAEEFYNEGISLSFEQWEVQGASNYISDESIPGNAYTDPAGTNSYGATLSNLTIKWDDSATIEQKQERIIIQKWIANWLLGNEAWADYRRTGYPRLIPATTAGNMSNGIVDSSRGARRMPYPIDEYSNNTENITTAVSQYLNGPDNMATPLWWDCKN